MSESKFNDNDPNIDRHVTLSNFREIVSSDLALKAMPTFFHLCTMLAQLRLYPQKNRLNLDVLRSLPTVNRSQKSRIL